MTQLHKWSKNLSNVDNSNFLKVNWVFISYLSKINTLCSIILYSSTFYNLFLPFFVLEMFKFKYKFFLRHFTSIFNFEWFEQPCLDIRWRDSLKKLPKVLISSRIPPLEVQVKISGKTKLKYDNWLKRIPTMTSKKKCCYERIKW